MPTRPRSFSIAPPWRLAMEEFINPAPVIHERRSTARVRVGMRAAVGTATGGNRSCTQRAAHKLMLHFVPGLQAERREPGDEHSRDPIDALEIFEASNVLHSRLTRLCPSHRTNRLTQEESHDTRASVSPPVAELTCPQRSRPPAARRRQINQTLNHKRLPHAVDTQAKP